MPASLGLMPRTQAAVKAARWKSKLFTATATWTVPADVGCIWIDGCAGGGGGGGGNSTPGGGGGGGSAGEALHFMPMPIIPGESITLTIGGNGAGGAANSNGTAGGITVLTTSNLTVRLSNGYLGTAGANPNGGNGGANYRSGGSAIAGGAGTGANATTITNGTAAYYATWPIQITRITTGAAGGALNNNGGLAYRQDFGIAAGYSNVAAASGGLSGGGGGAGGCGLWGVGGAGGANGNAGSNATGYGCGGGGGSGNAKGGDGSPGFIRIYCFTAYNI